MIRPEVPYQDCALVLRHDGHLCVYFLVKCNAVRKVIPYWQAPTTFSVSDMGELHVEERGAPDPLQTCFNAVLGEPLSEELLERLYKSGFFDGPFQQHPHLESDAQRVFFSFCGALMESVNRSLQTREGYAKVLCDMLRKRSQALDHNRV